MPNKIIDTTLNGQQNNLWDMPRPTLNATAPNVIKLKS